MMDPSRSDGRVSDPRAAVASLAKLGSRARYSVASEIGRRSAVGIPVLSRLRGSRRASWWITFVLIGSLGCAWALASPPGGAPDELDHVVTASATARGEIGGDPLSARQKAYMGPGYGQQSAYRSVDVPEILGRGNPACFAFKREATADCFHFSGSDRIGPVVTPVIWYPPAYYVFVGLVSRPFAPGGITVGVMRFATVLLMAALLASAVASLRRAEPSRLRLAGFLTALSPMVLFLNASVNPNGPEIAAALALWASGAVLLRELEDGAALDGRLVTRIGVAATVLALARQDSPLWLGLIVLTLAVLAGRTHLRAMWRSGRLRVWGAVVVVCTIAQVVWVIGVGTLAAEHSVFAPVELTTSEALRASIGRTFAWYHQAIGIFGWLDTPSPGLTVVLWTMVVGGIVLLAVGLGNKRWSTATVAVLGVTVLLPIVLEFAQARGIGTGRWQGRYVLPLAVGVPILAVFALEREKLGVRIASGILPSAIAVALGAAQIAAFAQSLRRYTVGYDGKIWFFLDPAWSPPLGAIALFVGFIVAVALTFAWLIAPAPPPVTSAPLDALLPAAPTRATTSAAPAASSPRPRPPSPRS